MLGGWLNQQEFVAAYPEGLYAYHIAARVQREQLLQDVVCAVRLCETPVSLLCVTKPDPTVKLLKYDVQRRQVAHTVNLTDAVAVADISPNGRYVAVINTKNYIAFHDICNDRRNIKQYPMQKETTYDSIDGCNMFRLLMWSPDSRHCLIYLRETIDEEYTEYGTLVLLDMQSLEDRVIDTNVIFSAEDRWLNNEYFFVCKNNTQQGYSAHRVVVSVCSTNGGAHRLELGPACEIVKACDGSIYLLLAKYLVRYERYHVENSERKIITRSNSAMELLPLGGNQVLFYRKGIRKMHASLLLYDNDKKIFAIPVPEMHIDSTIVRTQSGTIAFGRDIY